VLAVLVTLASLHLNDSRRYNQINPGLGIERFIGSTHVGAGAYVNSSARLSVYGVVGWETNPARRIGVGLEVGAVTGYSIPVLPLAFPYVRVGPLKVNVLPSRRPILGFQLRLRL
jgi:hypothetical protein